MSAETRKCRNCFQVKPLTEFYTKTYRGKTTHAYHCKGACHAEIQMTWMRKKREREMRARWDRLYGRTG